MDKHLLEAVLALHADRLQGDSQQFHNLLALFPEEREEVEELLQLARQLGETLVPLEADPLFRNRLHLSLLAAARERQAEQSMRRRRLSGPWAWAAAGAASAASVAVGVITYILWSRARANPARSL